MSASLVGSEMCIRDRPRGARWRTRGLGPGGPRRRRRGGRRRRWRAGKCAGCLLYTSDAADDM
eukprot:1183672-Alexandrium_andersonii.AAC.1